MANELLALPAPYGLGQKSVHVAITARNEDFEQVMNIARGLKCPPFILRKVGQCIKHSGRYDCLVNPDVDALRLQRQIRAIGGDVEIIVMQDDFQYAGRERNHVPSQMKEEMEHAEFALVLTPHGIGLDLIWREDRLAA